MLRILAPKQAHEEAQRNAEDLMREIVEPRLTSQGYELHGLDYAGHPNVAFIFRRISASNIELFDEIAVEYRYSQDELVDFQAASSIQRVALGAGIPRSMLVTNARFTPHARELIRVMGPGGFQSFEMDELRASIEELHEVSASNLAAINLIRRSASQQYIKLIHDNPTLLDRLEWRELERVMAEVFEGLGFGVRIGTGSKDKGKDVTLTCSLSARSHTYYVEIKHWRSPIGMKPVRNFLNVMVSDNVDGGLLLSSNGLSRSAIEGLTEVRRDLPLRIGTGAKITALCRSYVKMTASGIWIPESSPNELLFDDTI